MYKKSLGKCHWVLILLFFLNQQFITQSTMADHGSYFVTTLNRTKQKGKEKRIEKKLKEK